MGAATPAVVALAVCAPAANATSKRVPTEYYAMNYPAISTDSPARRQMHLGAIARSGIDEIRTTIHWNEIEARPPTAAGHSWRFVRPDTWIGDAARAGLRTQLTFAYTPPWASGAKGLDNTFCRSFNTVSDYPADPAQYVAALRQMVRRYGRDGTFWDENPGLTRRPVRSWEIWNEQNLTSYWCPAPNPELYADLFVLAARAVKSIDPEATVVFGGMTLASPSGAFAAPGPFLRRATLRQPSIRGLADAIGIHAYPYEPPASQLNVIAQFREQLRHGTIPDTTPMLLNEIGWTTGGQYPLTEAQRVERYDRMTRDLPRTNCNVSGMTPHAWTTREQNINQETDFYGLAAPMTGNPYPAGRAYVDAAALMRGETAQDPPTAEIATCAGMPRIDRDDDGVPDEDDPFPVDPQRPGGGCSQRLADLTMLVVSATGKQERRAALRKYRAAQRRCIPCARKYAKLSKRIAAATGSKRDALRAKRQRLRHRCTPCMRRLQRLQRRTLAAPPDVIANLVERHDRARRRCTGRA
jgi:hypothetical protein